MGNGYLCNLIFTFFKFTLKKFLFLKMMSDTMVSVSQSIFLIFNISVSYRVMGLLCWWLSQYDKISYLYHKKL